MLSLPSKLARYLANSIGFLGEEDSSEDGAQKKEHCGAAPGPDQVVLSLEEFSRLQEALVRTTDEMERLARAREENTSRIREYEALFSALLRKQLGGDADSSTSVIHDGDVSMLQQNVSMLHSNASTLHEERTMSYIKALKQDLLDTQERAESEQESLRTEVDNAKSIIRELSNRLVELKGDNTRLRNELAAAREELRANAHLSGE